jgi:hypothetical protein
MSTRFPFVTSFSLALALYAAAQAQNATARYVVHDLGALPGGGFSRGAHRAQTGLGWRSAYDLAMNRSLSWSICRVRSSILIRFGAGSTQLHSRLPGTQYELITLRILEDC